VPEDGHIWPKHAVRCDRLGFGPLYWNICQTINRRGRIKNYNGKLYGDGYDLFGRKFNIICHAGNYVT
jgi:hypothetical protein